MNINSENTKHIEVGKGLKMVKPSKIEEKVITHHPKFSPMKTKVFQMKVNDEEMDQLEIMERKQNNQSLKETTSTRFKMTMVTMPSLIVFWSMLQKSQEL